MASCFAAAAGGAAIADTVGTMHIEVSMRTSANRRREKLVIVRGSRFRAEVIQCSIASIIRIARAGQRVLRSAQRVSDAHIFYKTTLTVNITQKLTSINLFSP